MRFSVFLVGLFVFMFLFSLNSAFLVCGQRDAEIISVEAPERVKKGQGYILNLTVMNRNCGFFGADLRLNVFKDGVSVGNFSRYVLKGRTFSFSVPLKGPGKIEVKLIWHQKPLIGEAKDLLMDSKVVEVGSESVFGVVGGQQLILIVVAIVAVVLLVTLILVRGRPKR